MGRLLRRAVLAVVFGLAALAVILWWGLPARSAVRELARRPPVTTGVIQQRAAEAKARGRTFRPVQAWLPLSSVSKNLVHAVLSSEDQRFFGHQGVDWDAVKQSAETDWKSGAFTRGGSTITQQLAKNLFFDTRKNPLRKVREVLVSRWLEQDLGKKRILEIYLNVIEWGDGVFGCEAGARRWYGKSAAALDVKEAAGMAAMIPNPRVINPRVSPARFAAAQRRVLWLMAHAGYLRQGGLGAEPPAVETEDDEPPETAPPAPTSTEPAAPSPEATPPPSPDDPPSPPA